MVMKITMITFRVAKTLGDIMGAYRVIQTLCNTTSTKVKVDFIIYGENSEFAGLKNDDGGPILAAPNNNVEFNVHLVNINEVEIGLSLSMVKYVTANFATNLLSFFDDKIKIARKFFGVEKILEFLYKKTEAYEVENTRGCIRSMLSDQTGKYAAIHTGVMNADLLLGYSCPGLFLAVLQVYAGHKKLLPKNAWFISEYNGANARYNRDVQEVRSFPVPEGLQLKCINTGFPDSKSPTEPTFGVFSDEQKPQLLTEKEQRLLNNLGYSHTDIERQPGLFFGYVNYSTSRDGNALTTLNPKVGLEFFAITAIKQYLNFHGKTAQEKIKIDIIAPFNKVQCEAITKKLRLEYLNMAFYFVSGAEDGNLKVEPIDTHDPINTGVIYVRLINIFPTSPRLFKRLLQISEPFTIQTGDHSFIEAVLRKKVSLYQVMIWKVNFYMNFLKFFSEASHNSNAYVSNFILRAYALMRNDAQIDDSLQGLAKLIIDPDSFKHLSETFQIVADKINKELNVGDKLRVLLQESFPEFTISKKEEIEEKTNNNHGKIVLQPSNSSEQQRGVVIPAKTLLSHYQSQLNAEQESPPQAASSSISKCHFSTV